MRIRHLATMIAALKLLCKVFPLAATTVRPRIPASNLAAYDAGVAAVNVFCELLLGIDYIGDGQGSN